MVVVPTPRGHVDIPSIKSLQYIVGGKRHKIPPVKISPEGKMVRRNSKSVLTFFFLPRRPTTHGTTSAEVVEAGHGRAGPLHQAPNGSGGAKTPAATPAGGLRVLDCNHQVGGGRGTTARALLQNQSYQIETLGRRGKGNRRGNLGSLALNLTLAKAAPSAVMKNQKNTT
jgi:hypothetical protein